MNKYIFLVILVFLFVPLAKAQTADPDILKEINKIKIIDNHAHPLVVSPPDVPDNNYDIIHLDGLNGLILPPRLAPSNEEYIGAWHDLYGYPHKDFSEARIPEILEMKGKVLAKEQDHYPAWVLDKLGIETMLSNRIVMGKGLTAPNFLWVSYVDPLLFPLNTAAIRKQSPDYDYFYPDEEKALKRYMDRVEIKKLPATLDNYLTKVVDAVLEKDKKEGAIAIKFEAALLRSLYFADVPHQKANKIYAEYINGKEVDPTDYKTLQDFIFHHIVEKAGKLDLAVHIHVLAGPGSYYRLENSNPMLLENIFNEPKFRNVKFVIVHGGWPYTKETGILILTKPNVYADFSAQTFIISPRQLSEVLRSWITLAPDKILFGTDSFALTPFVSWEETCWLNSTTGRKALALALTGMVNDSEISKAQAIEIANLIMRNNAISLYKLKGSK